MHKRATNNQNCYLDWPGKHLYSWISSVSIIKLGKCMFWEQYNQIPKSNLISMFKNFTNHAKLLFLTLLELLLLFPCILLIKAVIFGTGQRIESI